jgi:hypothetical protein
MHCFPPAGNEDAFYFTGRAWKVEDDLVVAALRQQMMDERSLTELPPEGPGMLFEFAIERCLLTRTKGHGDWEPQHTVWQAPPG